MKFLVLLFSLTALSFVAPALAQSSGGVGAESSSEFASFETLFFRAFRVVDAPCPTDTFGDMCYLHDYDNVFDFKEQFDRLFPGSLTEVERWAATTVTIEGEDYEVFRATYRLQEGEPFTLTFNPAYILLEQ